MAEQISTENTKKILLEGNGPKATVRQKVAPSAKKRADVVVENATEKRYLWTARAFAVIFAVSLCCNLILTYVIMAVMPLYRIEPYLLSFSDKSEQIYHVEQIKNIYKFKYLTELFVREYILERNSFTNDIEEMEKRWGVNGTVCEKSSPAIYKQFKEFATQALEKIRQHSISREVTILSVTEVDVGKQRQSWWQVEFRISDMSPDRTVPTNAVWVANVGIKYVAKKVTFGERLKNPLGFTVTDYKVVQRK